MSKLWRTGDTFVLEGMKCLGGRKDRGRVIGVFQDLVWVWWEDLKQNEVVEAWQLEGVSRTVS